VSHTVSDHIGDRPEDWTAPGAALVHSAATDVVPPLAELGRVHIMGIAGSGMSALARILLERGLTVSGCEARDSITVAGLRALGATVHIGHSPVHLDEADTLVFTTAINPSHEELVAARTRGMRVLRRAAALAAALEDRRCIAVAGTHGKTSTTSLLVVAAQACGADPSFAIGGNLYETGKNAHLGTGAFAVVEADESDGSFLLTRPSAAVITNVEADHLENHGDLEGIFRAFELFVDRIDPDGFVLACADDRGARRMADYARGTGRTVRTYGTQPDADVRVSEIVTMPDAVEFTVTGVRDESPRRVRIGALIGAHMALNGTAALVLADHLGLDLDLAAKAWAGFGGVHRRFESHGEGGGVRVFDDYAHHPTEIAASLTAAKQALAGSSARGSHPAPGGRLIAVFQPGTYSRTQTFAREFAEAMAIADIAVVLDVFPAREEPIPGVTGETISRLIDLPADRVVYEPHYDAVPERIAALARRGDLVVTMGIGNVYLLCDEIRAACARALGGAA
jgi:UDP-N-acetylmuramate--alanine ligase